MVGSAANDTRLLLFFSGGCLVTRIPISLHIFSNSISAIVNAVAGTVAVFCVSDCVVVFGSRRLSPITPCGCDCRCRGCCGCVRRGGLFLRAGVTDAARVGQNLRLWPRSLQRLHLYRTCFACFDNDAIADMAVSCCELL